ncbi:MAG: ADP-forming succinate--CoA ligase subunit beta [Desulfotalea sp.]
MKIHEYQAKELFAKYSVAVPKGIVCTSVEEAVKAAAELNLPVAVKAQIHAGGRGKGGGVKLAKTSEEVQQYSDEILGMTLVTAQTGPEGRFVSKVLLEQGVSIARELYFSVIVDREQAGITIVASQDGGMDIEEVASSTPERIIKIHINPLIGPRGYHLSEAADKLDIPKEARKEFAAFVRGLYQLFVDYDCSMVEINPLIITDDKKLMALDAKVETDSNGSFRNKDLQAMHDPAEDDPAEAEAAKFNLNYIKLDGTVGNMVNGAGLAMATMDIIKQAGASPANFLDVGGSANAEMVENGFRIILSDPNVEAILINIFGGILRCDILAQGIVQAAKKIDLRVPVVIRMEGTNVEEGKRILAEADLSLISAEDLTDAAAKISELISK